LTAWFLKSFGHLVIWSLSCLCRGQQWWTIQAELILNKPNHVEAQNGLLYKSEFAGVTHQFAAMFAGWAIYVIDIFSSWLIEEYFPPPAQISGNMVYQDGGCYHINLLVMVFYMSHFGLEEIPDEKWWI
jgi:hypothetical protein